MKILEVSDSVKESLDMALEFYVRLGLGQFSEIATRLHLLHQMDEGKMERIRQLCGEMEYLIQEDRPLKLTDDNVSLYTLNAFLLEAELAEASGADRAKEIKWAKKRIKKLQKDERTK